MKVGVVDYDAGNLRSVETALAHLGTDFLTSRSPEELIGLDRLIFPGVGEAASAMAVLRQHGLDEMILEYVGSGKPVLGICIGYQIALDRSEERDATCLGIVPGVARRFLPEPGMKVPHMGWNQVWHKHRHPLFTGIPDGGSFYFVHSYYPDPAESEAIIAETEYGITFACAMAKENFVAVQFHPEKSGPYGLRLLQNFLEWERS